MSKDMSAFKKMKERITDEVNSATNKIQNMQIIDQLTSSITQPTFTTPTQLLPEPHQVPNIDSIRLNNQVSLIDDGIIGDVVRDYINEEEELNSDFMPSNIATNINSSQTVINVEELNSDLEEGLDNSPRSLKEEDPLEDVEIDLLSDRVSMEPTGDDSDLRTHFRSSLSGSVLSQCKSKYRSVVHALRKLNHELREEKNNHETKCRELERHIIALSAELDNLKQQQINSNQHDSLLSVSTTVSEQDKSSSGSPQPVTKASTKIKDLERILAKCKESLKQKNSQIANLRDSLSEVEKFKDCNQELRKELNELKDAHETWTVSIAENKRVMHQEIEDKLVEIEKLQQELSENNNKTRRLRSTIQDLESRLVSTSAAHQKERESLKRDLTNEKNNALKQLRKEHEHNLERVKLDLEKAILSKDEQLVGNTEKFQQELHELNTRIELLTTANDDQEKEINFLKQERENLNESHKTLKFEFEELSKKNESLARLIRDNETDMQTNQDQLDNLASVEKELEFLRKENISLTEKTTRLGLEIEEKNSDLLQMSTQKEQLLEQNARLKNELENTQKTSENFKEEKQTLISEAETSKKQRRQLDEYLVVGILAAIKNLETPNISPGSDKSQGDAYDNCGDRSFSECVGTDKPPTDQLKSLPDPTILLDELSSIALERCNSYMTTVQRLQAVLLENSVMSEEINRFKEELKNFSNQKNDDTQRSVEEVERLRTENQALIHDLHSYEDKLKELAGEQRARDAKINQLVEEKNAISKSNEEEIQFEYLKNIVYQFMLGKEPLVLARVISAVFKFDKSQIDQICKIQEAMHSALKQII